MKLLKTAARILIPVVLVSICFLGWANRKREILLEFKETRPYFGAYFTIQCRYNPSLTDMPRVMEKCWRRLDVIQMNMNAGSSDGYLGMINRSSPNIEVHVSDDLYNILEDAIYYSSITKGAFDITVRPLVNLWKQAAGENKLPSNEQLASMLDSTGMRRIELRPGNSVVLTKQGVKLDLNAIAPAFAVDRIASILEESRIENYMVDGSGEIRCKGNQLGELGWLVGVYDPSQQKGSEISDVLRLKNKAVSSSGNYERFNVIGGTKYSHIIDSRTGRPANQVASATVIASTAEEANVWSTSLCVLGAEEGLKLMKPYQEIEALVLEKKSDKILSYQTSGYSRFLSKN